MDKDEKEKKPKSLNIIIDEAESWSYHAFKEQEAAWLEEKNGGNKKEIIASAHELLKTPEKTVRGKFKHKSIFSKSSDDFWDHLKYHGCAISKAFVERLRKEKRLNYFYEKAKKNKILIFPDPAPPKDIMGNPRKHLPHEKLIYLKIGIPGKEGFRILHDFMDEFMKRVPTGKVADAKDLVV